MNARFSLFASKFCVAALALALGLTACTEQQTTTTDGGDTTLATQDPSPPAAADTARADTAAGGAVVQTAQNDTLGTYLTDGDGRAVYMFKKDQRGSGESTCYDTCAQAWPPVMASQGQPTARGQAQSGLLDTLQRRGGAAQLTYNGWPLYHFAQDQGADQLKGQDVMGFGAEWYLLTPKGTEVHAGES
jgi:predicted lipoprotein with Yx(FWY)xxD motif